MVTYYTTEATVELGTPTVAGMLTKSMGMQILPYAYTVPAATLLVTDYLILRRLPAGDVWFYPVLSRFQCTAGAASQTVDIGYQAYTGYDGAAVAADLNLFDDDVAVNGAIEAALGSDYIIATTTTTTGQYKLFQSRTGVNIVLTCAVAALVAAQTIKGYLVISQ
jgi:hypothetical protein